MLKGLKKLLMVQEEETGQVVYFLLFFLLVSAGMAVGRSTADAMFFKRFGIEYLPVMYIIQSFLLAMVSTLYAAFADRVPAESFFKVLFGVLTLLVAASWVVISYTGSSLVYPFYYLVYEVASELLLVHAALYVFQNMNTLQAKRLTPLFYAGAQIGTITGGTILALLAPVIGTQNLLLLWCLLLGAGITAIVLRHRRYGASTHFRAPGKTRNLLQACTRDIQQGIRYSYRSELLRAASLALFFMVMAFYILCYSVNRVYTHTFESEAALTSFFGGLTAVTSTIALLLQLFVTNRTIRHFGIRKVHLLFPLTTITSLVALAFSFALPAALLGSLNKDSLMPAFRNPIRTMFFNVLPGYLQGRVRAMSIAIVLPLALFFCGSLLWLMLKVEDTRYFLVPGMLAACGYLYFNLKMNRAYVSTLLNTLKEKLFLPDERLYAELQNSSEDVLEEITHGVNHEESEVAVAFSRALVDAFPDRAVDIILERVAQADNATADRLLRILAPLDIRPYIPQLLRLTEQGDNHLRATLLKMLIDQGDAQSLEIASGYLDSDNPRLRAVAICAALRKKGKPDVEAAWLGLLDAGLPSRLAALDLIPDLQLLDEAGRNRITTVYRQVITQLLQQQPDDIRIRVLRQLPRWTGDVDAAVPEILATDIVSDNPELREAVAGCLHLLVSPASDGLALQVLGDGHPGVRQAALQALQQLLPDFRDIAMRWVSDNQGNPRAQQVLIEYLQTTKLPNTAYESIAGRKADEASRLHDALAGLEQAIARDGETTSLVLLGHALRERLEQTIQLALLALTPLHEPGTIGIIRAGFSSGDTRHVANAIEALGNLDNRYVADRLHAILQDSTGKQHKGGTGMLGNLDSVLDWCLAQPDAWLRDCARYVRDYTAMEKAGA
jgi:hypothetical protein